jgi:hypothetical protein
LAWVACFLGFSVECLALVVTMLLVPLVRWWN